MKTGRPADIMCLVHQFRLTSIALMPSQVAHILLEQVYIGQTLIFQQRFPIEQVRTDHIV